MDVPDFFANLVPRLTNPLSADVYIRYRVTGVVVEQQDEKKPVSTRLGLAAVIRPVCRGTARCAHCRRPVARSQPIIGYVAAARCSTVSLGAGCDQH